MSKNMLDFQLKTIRDFQERHPQSHVGGSLGLLILGYDLKRSLDESDLDLICDEFNIDEFRKEFSIHNIEESSESNDFKYCFRRLFGSYYTKFDIAIDPRQSFQIVERNGEKYNVSLFENIIKFKREYAAKGYFKHEADIAAIETGVRPSPPISTCDFIEDELPF